MTKPPITKPDNQAILQLHGDFDAERLEKAYKRTRSRLSHLTAKGPLCYYRDSLLAEAYNAYRQLKGFMIPEDEIAKAKEKPAFKSVVARRAAILTQKVKVAQQAQSQTPSIAISDSKAATEDAFCREVIYRLEGDLIRFDSRRELLQIAQQMQIGTFKANFLMAQIIESVRANKLYITEKHKQAIKQSLIKYLVIGTTIISALMLEIWLLRYFRN